MRSGNRWSGILSFHSRRCSCYVLCVRFQVLFLTRAGVMSLRRNRPINLPAPYLRRVWLDPSRVTDRAAYPFCLPFLHDDFELISIGPSPSSSARTAPVNPPCSKVSPCWPAMTKPAAAKVIGRSIIPTRPRRWAASFPCVSRQLAAEGHQRLVLSGRKLLFRRKISREAAGTPCSLPISFPIPTARAFCASSRSAASARASTSSTNRNPRCRRRARWNS